MGAATAARADGARGDLHALRRAAELARPVTLAGVRALPVSSALATLLPEGIRRGAVVSVTATGAPGATSLALALGVAASEEGSWTAVVGHPALGLQAAGELGIDHGRLLVVPDVPPASWATVVAALVDGVDLVYARPPRGGVSAGDARRLAARVREREAVLVPLGSWPLSADLRLAVGPSTWTMAGGRLVARRAEVTASGRGVYARERRAELWLPGPDGRVAEV